MIKFSPKNRLNVFLVVLTSIVTSHAFAQTSNQLAANINAFLSTLSKAEQNAATFKFEDTLRTKWTNLPVGIAKRPGIRYGDLSEESKIHFHDILTTVFSSQGYLKTNNIMHLDDYLLEVYAIAHSKKLMNDADFEELKTLNWGHGNYYISIWGNPELDENWALKFEGHHLSLNITSVNGTMAITPFFLGTDPALVRFTQNAGIRSMSKEEDYGLELFNMLSEAQKTKAIISDQFPRDIITAPGKPQRLTSFQGIKGSALNNEQKEQFQYLILEYLRNFEREKAGQYINKIHNNGVDEIYFGWIGGNKRMTNHYYVINGPDFLIEYDNAGWIYNGDHIHTIFRDKKDDFGDDLLKTHYLQHKHN